MGKIGVWGFGIGGVGLIGELVRMVDRITVMYCSISDFSLKRKCLCTIRRMEQIEEGRKFCSTCKRYRNIEHFDEGYMSCRRCIEYMRDYRTMNKAKVDEWKSNYRERNKEEIALRNKEYREKHRDEKRLYNSLVVRCDVCDCEVRKCNLAKHKKTNKHMEKMRMQEAD